MNDWVMIICVMVVIGLFGLIVPYFLMKSSRGFKRKAIPVRVRVLEITEQEDIMSDGGGTWKPRFEIISGKYQGQSGTPRFGTVRFSHEVGDETDAFYDVESQHIESAGTLNIYSKISSQSYIISLLILILAGYLYYTKILIA